MEDEAATQPPAAHPRRWIRICLAVLAALLVAAVIAWTQRLAIASFAIERAAAAVGLETLTLTIDRLDLDKATVTDIRVGGADGQRIARLEARYSLSGLWRGTVNHLEVTGLSLRGRTGDDGLTLPGLRPPKASESDTPPPIPVRSIRYEDARIALETPQGTITVIADGIADTPDGKNSDIAATFSVTSPFGSATGRAAATRLGSGEIYGQIVLHDGDIAAPPVKTSGLRGTIQVIYLSGETADVDANLEIERLTVADEDLGATRLALGARVTDGSDVALEANLQSLRGGMDLTGNLSYKEVDGLTAEALYELALVRGEVEVTAEGATQIAVASDGRISGAFEIGNGAVARGNSRISGISGRSNFTRDPTGEMQGTAELAFETLEAHGFQTETGTVSATLDDRRVAIEAAVGWDGGALSLSADGPPDGAIRFETKGRLIAFQPVSYLLDGFRAAGHIAFSVAGDFNRPGGLLSANDADPLDLVGHIDARGEIDSDLHKVDVPGMARDAVLKGRIELANGDDGLRFTTPRLRARVGSLDSALLARLPDIVRTRLTGPFDLTIRPHDAEEAALSIKPGPDGHQILSNLAVHLGSKDAKASLRTRAWAQLTPEGNLAAISTPRAVFDLQVREKDLGDLSNRLIVSDLRFEGEQFGTRFDLKTALNGVVVEALAPLTATADITGQASLNGNILAARLDRGGTLSIKDVAVPDNLTVDGPITTTLTAPARLQVDIRKGLPSLAYTATAILSETSTRVRVDEDWLEIDLSSVPFTAKTRAGSHGVSLKADSLRIPDHKLQISSIALELAAEKELRAAASADKIEHHGKPAFFTPLSFTGNLTGSGSQLNFGGRLFDPSERISVKLTGHHDRDTKQGALSVDTQKLVFLPTVLQPVQLFPVLGQTMREVDGEVDMLANFAWHGDSVTSDMELLVNAKLIKADEFTFENAAAVVRFDSLIPPSTPPKQEVNIGLLDVGVPMLNGRLEFQFNKDGSVRAALRELDFFGGRIETDQFTIPKTYDGFTVPLQVNGVELDNLLALAQSGDLTATGTLNGLIPVAISSGEVAIRNGVLESAPGGGSIRYRPTAVGPSLAEANEGMELFLQIVDDFQYDKVKVTLNEDDENEVAFRFKIEGRNKEVYKGIPVELNIAMDGPLRKILTQGLKTYQLPERILSGMQRFEDKP